MVVWTMEKAAQLVEGLSQATTGAGGSITVLVWWAFYMSVFWSGFTVERARQRAPAPTQVPIVSSEVPESSPHTAASPTATSPPAQALLGDPSVQTAGPSHHNLELIRNSASCTPLATYGRRVRQEKAELLKRVSRLRRGCKVRQYRGNLGGVGKGLVAKLVPGIGTRLLLFCFLVYIMLTEGQNRITN